MFKKIRRIFRKDTETQEGGMYIIVGLGNPDRQYQNTRHNIGFEVVDEIARKNQITIGERKHKAVIGKGYVGGQKAVLVKPQTYMNLSGESIRGIVDYYKVDPEEGLLVIYDDISLSPGQIRVRSKGSAGGHNGVRNIIANLGTDVFARIKVGIGEKPRQYDLADYVLGYFSKEEREIMDESIMRAVEAVEVMITQGADAAMNLYNKKIK